MFCIFTLLLFSLLGANVSADWPQWMGSSRDGLSSETGLLHDWPTTGPERVWLFADCGVGYSGPAIADGELFILGSRQETEQLLCLNVKTGKELWSVDIAPEYQNGWGNGPRSTPTVVDNRVYCLTAKGILACVDRLAGEELWRVDLKDFGGKIPKWGYSESPLIEGGRVIVTPGGAEGALLALDQTTGEKVWQTAKLTSEAHYSSIVPAAIHGQDQYIQLLHDQLIGLEPASGNVLWSVPWPGEIAVIPTPLVQDNQIYVTSGYGVGCMLVDIAADGTPTVAYENKRMKNHHGGVLLLNERVYGHSDKVGWLCQDFATGDVVWRERSALGKGAIAYADGRFYCLSEKAGEVVLIEASPEGWTEHGRFTLEPQTTLRKPKGKIWTHPVIAGGKLYLRDQELLFCFDIAAE